MSATILLADDSPTIQKVVELTFAETPHQVVAVSSGSELLARLPEVKPDVVICDVIMPDRDGYDVCQTIKSSPETLHIPVILLTGTFEPFDRDRALAVGCDEIVTKPFEARQLIATVEKLVSGEAPAAPEPQLAGGEEEYGTYLVAPPAGEPSEPEVPAEPEAEAPAPAEEMPAAAEAPADAFPPAGPEGEGGLPEEGLDFTTTGFAEMEAAGQQPRVPMEPPEEGLEIEESTVEPPGQAPAEAPGETPFPAGGEVWEPPEEEAAPPSDTAPVSPPEEESWGFGAEAAQPPAGAEEDAGAAPEVFAEDAAPEAVAESGAGTEAAPGAEASPEPSAAAAAEPAAEGRAEAWQESEPEPEPPAEPAAGTVTAPMPIPPAAAGTLSEEDVDRIARRVVELFQDRLEQIAWEVIPDMAEIVVRERVRQIEEEIEAGGE